VRVALVHDFRVTTTFPGRGPLQLAEVLQDLLEWIGSVDHGNELTALTQLGHVDEILSIAANDENAHVSLPALPEPWSEQKCLKDCRQ
jgi:hypothetical protein